MPDTLTQWLWFTFYTVGSVGGWLTLLAMAVVVGLDRLAARRGK